MERKKNCTLTLMNVRSHNEYETTTATTTKIDVHFEGLYWMISCEHIVKHNAHGGHKPSYQVHLMQ